MTSPAQAVRRPLDRFATRHARGIELVARVGYAARGAVYVLVGVLALQVALGTGGATTGTKGAISRIVHQPFGTVLLALTALGLAAFVLWRFTQAVADPEGLGRDAKGLVRRVAMGISGLIYASLAWAAASLALGSPSGGGSGGGAQETWTARLLSQPFGQWLVAGVGAIVAVVALRQLQRAFTARFERKLDGELHGRRHDLAVLSGRLGYGARGVVFAILA